MTKEEAIKKVKGYLTDCLPADCCREVEEIIEALEQEPFINKSCISSGVCEHDKNKTLDKLRAEIKKWYWQADKQTLAKDPCVIDAMIDLFIRTIDKYKAKNEE